METEAPVKRSPEDLINLKNEWCADPYWDLEDSPGFEAHHDELQAFSQELDARWDAENHARLEERANLLGCPGNLELAQYIEALEYRIDLLIDRLETVEAAQGPF